MVIYTLVIAAIWQASGLVMAIMLAGLRGVDEDIWKATRVDGIPPWRVYLSIVLPMLRPMLITATVLLAIAVVKALRPRGRDDRRRARASPPKLPAKFVMDHLFERGNVGLATGCATVMLITVIAVLAPWLYAEHRRPEEAADGMTACDRPSGRRPQPRSPAGRLGVYAFLVARRAVLPAAALGHAADVAEDHGRDPAGQHPGLAAALTFQPWVAAWAVGLHRAALRRHQRRLLELGPDPDPIGHPLDRCWARSTATRCLLAGARRRAFCSASC